MLVAYEGCETYFKLIAIPCTIESFPRLTVSGVIKLILPSSSPGPYRFQAFRGGPGRCTGKAENGGSSEDDLAFEDIFVELLKRE